MDTPIRQSDAESCILSGDYYGFLQQQARLQRSLNAEARQAHCETLDSWQPATGEPDPPATIEGILRGIAAMRAEFARQHKGGP